MAKDLFSWSQISAVAILGTSVPPVGLNDMSTVVHFYMFLHFLAHMIFGAIQTTPILLVGWLLKFECVCVRARIHVKSSRESA